MKGEGGGQNSVHVVVECPLASLTITTLSDLKYLICLQDSERGWHKIKYERMQYLCQLLIIEVLVGLWSFGILFWHTIKKMFQWLRKTFEIQGYRPRICQNFEITKSNLFEQWKVRKNFGKVNIFWLGHKILRNLHRTFFLCSASQK